MCVTLKIVSFFFVNDMELTHSQNFFFYLNKLYSIHILSSSILRSLIPMEFSIIDRISKARLSLLKWVRQARRDENETVQCTDNNQLLISFQICVSKYMRSYWNALCKALSHKANVFICEWRQKSGYVPSFSACMYVYEQEKHTNIRILMREHILMFAKYLADSILSSLRLQVSSSYSGIWE